MHKFLRSVILTFASVCVALSPSFASPPVSIAQEKQESVVILGGGVGALTASLYLARAGQSPIVIEGKTPGGLITQSHSVQNWPGEMEIDGQALAEKIHSQAAANGVRFLNEEVTQVDFSKRPFAITTRSLDGKKTERTIFAQACIIAMGTQPNFLQVPGETGPNGYWGKGVTNCAVCDGNLYRDRVVGVVGGGDAAVLEALYLSHIAKQVYVFVRQDHLKAKEAKRVQQLLERPNVQIRYQTRVQQIQGDGKRLTHVELQEKNQKATQLALDGLFLAIGSTPNTQVFQKVLQLDEKGYIVLTQDQQTSIPGVYAVGDIVDPIYKQAISAAGDGAKAALQAQQFLSDQSLQPIATQAPREEKKEKQVVEILSMEQFEKELKGSSVPVLVDFYATWCGPCKQVSPLFEASASQLQGKAKFLKVNVDRVTDLTRRYDIQSMPTVLVFDQQGKIVDRKIGTDQIAVFLDHLDKPSPKK